ncbi:conserved hypothetical protein [Acinetobacter proteolyticus]|uniref:Uncharacterized protein n=1 Tax=Acinetobacter proteolyticus TaxID=1776741 RepID=A0A653K1H8_9GAMM|nr:hypothetical protein [Acinetobacter proteolyticus]VXA54278.1 conserved hypothetical protein [Acinetobacter proteolyticus]
MNKDQQRELDLINRRNLMIGAGVLTTALGASTTQAAITGAQLEGKYQESGAEETGDSAGLIIIGLAIAAMIVGFIIRIVRKG